MRFVRGLTVETTIRSTKGVKDHCKDRQIKFINVSSYFTFPPNFKNSGLLESGPVPMPYRPGSGSWGYHHSKHLNLHQPLRLLMYVLCCSVPLLE
jgi:hypothetical protein